MVDIAPLNPPRTAAENPRSVLTFEPASRCADGFGLSALGRSDPVEENRGPKYWASRAPSTGPERMASHFLRRMPQPCRFSPVDLWLVRRVRTVFESSNTGRHFRSREHE